MPLEIHRHRTCRIGILANDQGPRDAMTQLAAQLEQTFPKLSPRAPVIDGRVADAAESGHLVLNVGSQDGVKAGDRLQLWRPGKEIRDPAKGKVLMRDDTPLGQVVISTVNDRFSIAQCQGTEPIKVGDLVKSFPKEK